MNKYHISYKFDRKSKAKITIWADTEEEALKIARREALGTITEEHIKKGETK